MKIAFVGCGKISDVYFKNIQEKFKTLEIVACCANHLEHALEKGKQFGIQGCTLEEILADPSIEMILILTPAPTHYKLIKQGLEASKHVYTEKPVSTNTAEAEELRQLARARGLYLGSAPETFLSAAFQTARKAIIDGKLGRISSFNIACNRDYTVLSSIFCFLRQPGGGICFDYSVYHLTALVNLLGPVKSVYARLQNPKPIRKCIVPSMPDFGQDFESPNESLAVAILEMESGVVGTLMLNGESNLMDLPDFRIYGSEGILVLPDANQFVGDAIFYPNTRKLCHEKIVLEPVSDITTESRGIGVYDMEAAIRENRPCRTNIETALHVLRVIEKMTISSETGKTELID